MMDQDDNPASGLRLVQNQVACEKSPGSNSPRWWQSQELLIGCFGLGLAILFVFWPVLHSDFINLDDGEYILQNPHVATGLSAANLVWAFTTDWASNWHPLTWLSHMLDVQLFGLHPSGPHAVNLLLHIANSLLLFLLLRRLTGAVGRSFAVAGLFALHPLHVESVAWIAERKDVLSTLFFLLTLWAYANYAKGKDTQAFGQSSRRAYYISLACFALGLMSKPMLVTLPLVLLLMDFWPLGRIVWARSPSPDWIPLLREKLPFFALSLVACVLTLLVQGRAHSVKVFLPMGLRLENAVVSYATYLAKTLWPVRLSVFYPHPNTRYGLPQSNPGLPASEQWPLWGVLVALVALAAVSWLFIRWRQRAPWLVTGWFWYLGTLVPVIGIIQVGMQAMADRYTYIPLIGIFVALVWSVASGWRKLGFPQPALAGVLGVTLLSCAWVARVQVGYWQDDFTLFQHALAVTTHNAVAECHVGVGLAKAGQLDPAETHFKQAIADDPFFYAAYASLGSLYEVQGKTNEAMQQYQTTLKMRPWDEFARLHLAGLLHKMGRDDEAIAEYKRALQANPDSVEGNYQLGSLLQDRGALDSAGPYLSKAADLKPDHVDALLCLSELRAKQHKFPAAQAALEQVVRLYPTNFELRINLASLLWDSGKEIEALEQYTEAVRLKPEAPIGHYDLAVAYAGRGRLRDASHELEQAVQLKPDYTAALSELGWLLSTSPRAEERDAGRALQLAQRALAAGGASQSRTWAALDAAYAENGQFARAIESAEKARALALAEGQTNLAEAAEQRLLLYRNQKPFRQRP